MPVPHHRGSTMRNPPWHRPPHHSPATLDKPRQGRPARHRPPNPKTAARNGRIHTVAHATNAHNQFGAKKPKRTTRAWTFTAHLLDCEAPLCQFLIIAAVDCKIRHGTAHHITAPPPRTSPVRGAPHDTGRETQKQPPEMAEFTPSPTPRMHTIDSAQKCPNVRPERGLSHLLATALCSTES